jgi:hypothetical protein
MDGDDRDMAFLFRLAGGIKGAERYRCLANDGRVDFTFKAKDTDDARKKILEKFPNVRLQETVHSYSDVGSKTGLGWWLISFYKAGRIHNSSVDRNRGI